MLIIILKFFLASLATLQATTPAQVLNSRPQSMVSIIFHLFERSPTIQNYNSKNNVSMVQLAIKDLHMAISYLQVRTRTNRLLNNKPVIHNRIWEWLSRSSQSQRNHNKSWPTTAQALQQTNKLSDKPCLSSSKIVRAVLRLRRCSSSRLSSSDRRMLLKAQPTRCYSLRRMQRIKCSSIISINRRVEGSSSLLP